MPWPWNKEIVRERRQRAQAEERECTWRALRCPAPGGEEERRRWTRTRDRVRSLPLSSPCPSPHRRFWTRFIFSLK
jgi:hypothetical protein